VSGWGNDFAPALILAIIGGVLLLIASVLKMLALAGVL
jgi:hypothetical protein